MGGGHAFVFDAQTKITIFNWGGILSRLPRPIRRGMGETGARSAQPFRGSPCSATATTATQSAVGKRRRLLLSRHVYEEGYALENASVTMPALMKRCDKLRLVQVAHCLQLRQGAAQLNRPLRNPTYVGPHAHHTRASWPGGEHQLLVDDTIPPPRLRQKSPAQLAAAHGAMMSSRYLQHGSDGAGPNGEHELDVGHRACLQQPCFVCYVPDTGLARGERVSSTCARHCPRRAR